jgi:methylated-DNA-[protein]-cysteine S-methyltransferase
MNLCFDTFPTRFGPFTVAVDAAGAVVATAFGDETRLRQRLRHPAELRRDPHACTAARRQLLDYLAGRRREFDLPLAPAGTPFQVRVWAALRTIPFGETRTYGQLAAQIGRPSAARAVGRANATNPVCVLVPCHRVIGADGSLTGFAFGEDLKRGLLALEQPPAGP